MIAQKVMIIRSNSMIFSFFKQCYKLHIITTKVENYFLKYVYFYVIIKNANIIPKVNIDNA